jgi:hypothetical protein
MKKNIVLTSAILLLAFAASAQKRDSFTVYLFLLEDCKITQAYTDRLIEIQAKYAGDSIGFVAFFPNPISNDSTVAGFREKYHLPFTCTVRQAAEKAGLLGITVTPEVALVNENTQKTLYQGRIDNMFERVGERRQVVTSFELEAALHAVRHCKEVPIPRTQPTGCFLPKRQR